MESSVDIEKDAESQTRLRSNGDPLSCDSIGSASKVRSNRPPISQPEEGPLVLGWKERLRYFTWTWFTLSMATGGIAAVIYNGSVHIFYTVAMLQNV